MSNDDWIKKLYDRLENHTVEPPKDLWQGIEAQMNRQRRQRRALSVRRYAAAAVLLGAIVMATVYYLGTDDNTVIRQQTAGSSVAASSQSGSGPATEPEGAEETNPITMPINTDEKLLTFVQKNNSVDSGFRNEPFDHPKEPISQPEMNPLTTQNEPFEKQEETKSKNSSVSAPYEKSRNLPASETWTTDKTARSRQQRWTVGAHTTGIFANDNSINGVMLASEPMITAAKQSVGFLTAAQATSKRYEKKEHHQPVQIGLTAGYKLSDKLTITSGMVYTRTTSDFIRVTGQSEMTDKQTLQYIGVPVGVNYNVWQTGRFKAYITAGAQADFNVKATVETEDVKVNTAKDRMQWSVNAAAGAQYDLVPQVGIYAEPGLKYYINNRSDIENVFKSRPCSFSLQVGIRLNIK